MTENFVMTNRMNRLQELAELKATHNNPAYSKMSFMMGLGVQARGEGSRVYMEQGDSYLAMFDQYGNQSFGYSHPNFISVAIDKLKSGNINSTKILFEEDQVKLAEALSKATGGVLSCVYFANGGGETIDNALKLARAKKRGGRIISANGCFHGKTFATITTSNRPEHFEMFQPMLQGFETVDFGDLDALVSVMDDDVAALILELVQAENGVKIPSKRYLEAARALCDKFGAALIFDEMQTAFGRTGYQFAFQTFSVMPDMVCIGKAFGGGIVPISAVLAKPEYWQIFKTLPSAFGSSLGGNPLSCAIAQEVVSMSGDNQFLAEVRRKGEIIDGFLQKLLSEYHDILLDVRGIGMMYGLELKSDEAAGLMLRLLLEEGVTSTYSLYNTRVIRIQPPMIISDSDLISGLHAFERAFSKIRSLIDDDEIAASINRKLEFSFETKIPTSELIRMLHENPYLVDPFVDEVRSSHDQRTGCLVEGKINGSSMTWWDDQTYNDSSVLLDARTCWVWAILRRSYHVAAGKNGGRLDIKIEWDAGAHYYEDFLSLSIGYKIKSILNNRIRVLEEPCV